MASPTRSLFAPGKQARVSLSFSETIAQRVNQRCRELGCDPKDYVRYCVMRELDSPGHQHARRLEELESEPGLSNF
jgi:hypothetical protein